MYYFVVVVVAVSTVLYLFIFIVFTESAKGLTTSDEKRFYHNYFQDPSEVWLL